MKALIATVALSALIGSIPAVAAAQGRAPRVLSTGPVMTLGAAVDMKLRFTPTMDGGKWITWDQQNGAVDYIVERWRQDQPDCCKRSSGPLSAAALTANGWGWQDGPLAIGYTWVYQTTARSAQGNSTQQLTLPLVSAVQSATFRPLDPAPAFGPVSLAVFASGADVSTGQHGALDFAMPADPSSPQLIVEVAGNGGTLPPGEYELRLVFGGVDNAVTVDTKVRRAPGVAATPYTSCDLHPAAYGGPTQDCAVRFKIPNVYFSFWLNFLRPGGRSHTRLESISLFRLP